MDSYLVENYTDYFWRTYFCWKWFGCINFSFFLKFSIFSVSKNGGNPEMCKSNFWQKLGLQNLS